MSRGAAKPKRVIAAPAYTTLERASEEDASDTMVRHPTAAATVIITVVKSS